jgi:hypothetical protein
MTERMGSVEARVFILSGKSSVTLVNGGSTDETPEMSWSRDAFKVCQVHQWRSRFAWCR